MELKTFTATDLQGNVIPAATVTVYEAGTSTLMTGLVDKDGNPLANPLTADAKGLFQFAKADGYADIRISGRGRDFTIPSVQFFDFLANYADIVAKQAQVAADRLVVQAMRDTAVSAADAAGVPIAAYYATKAAADADIGSRTDGDWVEVLQDEAQSGARTRYEVVTGAYVFRLNLDQLRVDMASALEGLGADLLPGTGKVVADAATAKSLTANTTVKNIFILSADGGPFVDRGNAGTPGDGDSATNCGTWFCDLTGRMWERMFEGPVNSSWFGAGWSSGNRGTYGTYAQACVFSFQANQDPNDKPDVNGLANNAALSAFPSRDSVCLYADNYSPIPLIDVPDSGTTYTATGMSFSAPIDTALLKAGMIVDTKHSPKWSGFVQSWTSTSITVAAWQESGGTSGTPANGTGAIVNPITKVWAGNFNIFLDDDSQYSTSGTYLEATGVEVGVIDDSTKGTQPLTVGIDIPCLGSRDSKFGAWARGASHSSPSQEVGFVSWDHRGAGFRAQYGKTSSWNFHSIGVGVATSGAGAQAGFYDHQSTLSFLAQPAPGGDAIVVQAPSGAIKRLEVDDTGKTTIRTTDASRAFSVKSTDDATEYFGISPNGRIGPMAKRITTVSAATYTTTGGDYVLVAVAGAGTINLVDATLFPGREFEVINRSGGNVTVDPSGAQTVDGAATATVANNTSARFISDGSNWLKP